jgi:hypothetical protein
MMAVNQRLFHPLSPFFHPHGVKEVGSKKAWNIEKNNYSLFFFLSFTLSPSRTTFLHPHACMCARGGERRERSCGIASVPLDLVARVRAVGDVLAHVASLVAGWPMTPTTATVAHNANKRPRRIQRVHTTGLGEGNKMLSHRHVRANVCGNTRNVITHIYEQYPNVYAHKRELFTVVGHSQIGTPGRFAAADGRGNANRWQLTFFREKKGRRAHNKRAGPPRCRP